MRLSPLYVVFCLLGLLAVWHGAAAQLALTGAGPSAPGGGGSCFSYSGTPIYQSLTFTDSWSLTNSTLATNALPSPDCLTGGATLTDNSTSGFHDLTKNISSSVGSRQVTVFVKRNSGTLNYWLEILDTTAFSSEVDAQNDLGTCASHIAPSVSGADFSAPSAVFSLYSGWCKMVLTFTQAVSTGVRIQLFMTNASYAVTYVGTGSSDGFWGLDYR